MEFIRQEALDQLTEADERNVNESRQGGAEVQALLGKGNRTTSGNDSLHQLVIVLLICSQSVTMQLHHI